MRDIAAIEQALSESRIARYRAAVQNSENEYQDALELYLLNAQVSGLFFILLHICEVTVRNAVAEALTEKYGKRWPWAPAFLRSLPRHHGGPSPYKRLQKAAHQKNTVEQIIPELNFVFWQKMFTSRHDERIWNKYLFHVMPSLNASISIGDLRKGLHDDLGKIRLFRNRIAHHEPIMERNLDEDMERIIRVISYRSQETSYWISSRINEEISEIIKKINDIRNTTKD